MLGVPMADVVAGLPVAAVIQTALLHGTGADGLALAAIRRHEMGESDPPVGVDPDAFARIYLESLVWARETTGLFGVH